MEAWRDELYHHGILGQKWGVRRYQNPDGTRTRLGKLRIANDFETAYKRYPSERKRERLRNKFTKKIMKTKEFEDLKNSKEAKDYYRESKRHADAVESKINELNQQYEKLSVQKDHQSDFMKFFDRQDYVYEGLSNWMAGPAGQKSIQEFQKAESEVYKKGREMVESMMELSSFRDSPKNLLADSLVRELPHQEFIDDYFW